MTYTFDQIIPMMDGDLTHYSKGQLCDMQDDLWVLHSCIMSAIRFQDVPISAHQRATIGIRMAWEEWSPFETIDGMRRPPRYPESKTDLLTRLDGIDAGLRKVGHELSGRPPG